MLEGGEDVINNELDEKALLSSDDPELRKLGRELRLKRRHNAAKL